MDYATEKPNALRQAVKKGLIATLPARVFMVQRPRASRALFLTFDDGPHPEHTPAVLDVLARHGATATFFMVGREIAAHPEIVRRIHDEGHTVAHHSYYHSEPSTTSAEQLEAEVQRTVTLLTETVGEAPRFFRPPHGKLTAGKLWSLVRHEQTVVLWNVDPKDFAAPDGEAVVRWFEQRPPVAGDIVLMHDNHPQAAEALPRVLEMAKETGLEVRGLAMHDIA